MRLTVREYSGSRKMKGRPIQLSFHLPPFALCMFPTAQCSRHTIHPKHNSSPQTPIPSPSFFSLHPHLSHNTQTHSHLLPFRTLHHTPPHSLPLPSTHNTNQRGRNRGMTDITQTTQSDPILPHSSRCDTETTCLMCDNDGNSVRMIGRNALVKRFSALLLAFDHLSISCYSR